MVNALKSIKKSFFSKVFADRKIVMISDEKMRSVTITGKIQALILVLIIAGVVWIPFSAGRVAAYDNVAENEIYLSENYDNVERRVELMERNLDVLEQYMKALYSTGIRFKNSDDLEKKNLDRLSLLEYEYNAMISTFNRQTVEKISQLEGALTAVGVDYSKLQGLRVKAVGGPYIAAETASFGSEDNNRLNYLDDNVAGNFKHLYYLQKVADELPLMSPIASPRITSSYGLRRDPYKKRASMHSGVDMAGVRNTSVHNTAPGIVVMAKRNGAYGLMVEVEHSNNIKTRYGHLKTISVAVGEKVARGDVLGIQGSTGRSTGDHLHYEIRLNGKAINPMKFIKEAKNMRFAIDG